MNYTFSASNLYKEVSVLGPPLRS